MSERSEIWKTISGFENYEVSNLGRVRNKKKLNILKPTVVMPRGYLKVVLSRSGKGSGKLIHRLVALEFIGPCEAGKQCAHLNGKAADNRLENLAWVTQSENEMHKYAHGTMPSGSKHWNSKLTEAQVRDIKNRFGNGQGGEVAAYCYSIGLDPHLAYDVLSGKRWRAVT